MHSSLFAVLSALICVTSSAPFPGPQCPVTCECTTSEQVAERRSTKLRCPSMEFLENLSLNQVNTIEYLDVSNANLTKLDGKVKKLRALKSLDLSHNGLGKFATDLSPLHKLTHLYLRSNNMKHFTSFKVPRRLEHLDLSHNHFAQIPEGLTKLKHLREVNFDENSFACNCDNKNECDALIAAGVTFVKPLTCYSNEKIILLNTLNCSALMRGNELDEMQADEPQEGSGEEMEDIDDGDFSDENLIGDRSFGKLQHLDGEELFPAKSGEEDEEDVEMEGSGEENTEKDDLEGSGDSFAIISSNEEERKACYFEPCAPIKIDEKFYENSTEKNPELGKEIIEGIKETFGFGGADESNVKVAQETHESDKTEDVHEDDLDKTRVIKLETGPTAVSDEKAKIEKAAMDSSSSTQFELSNNMIIVLALIVIMVCIVVYSICVKRKGRAVPRQPIEQEMKPLKKKEPIVSSNNGNAPEKEPLMNGRNGNMNGKPVEEPVSHRRDEELETSPLQNDNDFAMRRTNNKDEGDLPETHRVTVQAKELSAPKTPRLVIRSKAHNGEIITTPSLNRYP